MMSSPRTRSAATSQASSQRTGLLPLVAICLGFFMIMMDVTVVNTALPDIGRSLHASVTGLQWVLDGYTLVFACLLLSGGSLGDRLGARRVFLAGVALFTAASAMCGLAPSLAVLNAARIVQGTGAALALPASLALINASYPDRAQRARAIGIWGGMGGLAAGLGPVLGGILTGSAGWPAIFYINVPIGVLALILTLRCVVAPAAGRRAGLDLPGQVLAVCAVGGLAYGLIEGAARGWAAPEVVAAFAAATVSGGGFVLAEYHRDDPMLPLGLFRSRQFSGSILVGAAINLGFYGELFLLSLYLQHVRHFSPLVVGLALLPQAGVVSVASFFGGRRTARRGPRPVMLTGLATGTVGLLAMTLAGSRTPYGAMIVPLILIGFGIAYTMPAATAATIDAARAHQAGIASGALNASRQIGSTLGVAIFGALVASASTFMTGYRISVLIGGLVFAAAAFVVLRTIPRSLTSAR
jgi:DHA2 family methylenomycin A resistance protein-like MFS transporter